MGGTLHRLEALLVGLILLLAGGVATIALVARAPSAPSPHAQPLPPAAGPSAPWPAPERAAPATEPPAAAPPKPAAPTATALPAGLAASWPWLLLVVGAAGIVGAIARLRRRTLGYTRQTIGQLLAAADAATRASNIRVMRQLADQGLLPASLAASAGLGARRWPESFAVRLPRLSWPALKRPTPWRAAARLARRGSRPPASHTSPAAPPSALEDVSTRAPRSAHAEPSHAAAGAVTHEDAAASRCAGVAWTAEDCALAVAAALHHIWAGERLQSRVLALDAAVASGGGRVVVTVDAHPGEQQRLLDVPERIAAEHTRWRAFWHWDSLVVEVVAGGAPAPASGPLLAPILSHGRGGKTTRFVPLATWRSLGLYGGDAIGALHALLGSLLYSQPPQQLALAILDRGEIAPLYRHVPHLAPPPAAAPEALELLAQELRRARRGALRPLLLAVVEPDDALLSSLLDVVGRLRAQPDAPLHLVVAQERPREAGRELYALLPALITAGAGPATPLPGQGDWPRRGAARLLARGLKLDGRPLTLDEAGAAALLAELRGRPEPLPPVLWDAAAPETRGEAPHNVRPPEPAAPASPAPPIAGPAGRTGGWLGDLLARDGQPRQRSDDAAPPPRPPGADPANGWPAGPDPLGPQELADLLTRIVTAPAITDGQDDQTGLSKNRLAELLACPRPQAKELAAVLMVWFDRAGVLAEPRTPGRLHQPRRLATADLAALAARLSATPLPDATAAQAAWAESAAHGGIR